MNKSRIDFEEYRAINAINWSTLREMLNSPAHYRYRIEHQKLDTAGLAFGRACHTAVLEPDQFPLLYVVFEGARRQGKVWDEFKAANATKTILKRDEYDKVLSVRDAVRSHDGAMALLKGESEVTIEWTDAATGLACKGRIDHLHNGIMTDLKTSTTTDAWAFSSTAARLLYHGQAGFYQMGLGEYVDEKFIVVESEPPFDVAVFNVPEDVQLAGRQLATDLLGRVAQCTERDEWPGRYVTEQEFLLPSWMEADPDNGWGDLPERSE